MKHKFSLILFSALLSTTFAWGANVIKPGTYSGTWTQHSIEQLDGKVRTATEVIVSEENDGKQIITFKGYKVGYDGDVATDIKIEVTTSNGACTIAKDTETGHTNATYGVMYIRTYANYTSSINPQSMMITLCAHYYYYKSGTTTELLPGDNKYEYIQLNPTDWTEWIDFPEEGKNTATWTFNTNNAFYSLINPSCQVTLQSRQSVSNPLLKQILVKGFKMNASSVNYCIATDLVLNWDTETNEITMAYSGLGFYESTAKQARGKITSTGEFDFATGKFTLPVEYVYAGTWKSAVQETLMLSDIVPLESIYITPKYLLEGNSVTYTAKLTPANATFSNLIWTIDDPEVATIDRNATNPLKATVTKVEEGSATITATLGSVSTTAKIYVGNYGDWKDYQIDEHPAYGVWKMNSMYTTPQEIPNQQIQVCSFSADEHFKKIKILNFGAGLLSNEGVPVEMKWDTYDNIVTIAKQETGKTKTTEDYTSPIYIADNSYFSGGVNTSHFDEQNNLFEITPVYFYYKTATALATAYARAIDTLQLYPVKVTRDNATKHTKYIVPIEGGDAYFEGTEASKAYQMMFKLEGTDFDSASWVVTTPDWVNVTSEGVKQYTDFIGIKFQVEGYTLTPREGTIKVDVYGYTFEMPISQAALPSAYYEVPAGAFFAGMTDNSSAADPTFYVPYRHYETNPHQFSSKEAGTWKTDQGESSSQTSLSCANEMLKTCTTPQLIQDGKISFQYGATSNEYNSDLTFYVGDSVMRYMTPARLWTDLNTNPTGYQEGYADGYKTIASEKMGVYFNNIDTMYIDGISIPISAGSTEAAKQKTETNLFGTSGSVTVNIYHARIEGDNKEKVDVDNPIWTGTLTKKDIIFTPLSQTESYRGALNATFTDSISITGPFVVELSDMSGCDFYVLSDKSNGKNKWGYYIKEGTTTYPTNYCLAVSVHGMFPTLYPEADKSLTIDNIPAEGVSKEKGGRPVRTIYANGEYITKGANGWSFSITENSGISVVYNYKTKNSTPWYFSMGENTTNDIREGDVTFTFRGKSLTYHVIQEAAPTTYTRDNLTAGEWGTICLPYAAESFSGAEMYSIAGKMEGDAGIYLDQVATMEAGKPYIFKATDNEIVVVYTAGGGYQKAKSANGLCGYIGESEESYITVPVDGNSYIVYDNALYLVDSEVTLVSNRAYIKYSEVGTPSQAPQVRRVAMPINGAPANMLQVSDTKQAVKILRDGHIVILRADKEYDILGQSK